VHSYNAYDTYWNLLRETAQDGIVTSYEWGHNSSLVTFVRTNPDNPQVSYFDHAPMIGLNYVTDPAGRNTFYLYDILNRLKVIKDHDSNIVNRYLYHYKNATEFGANYSFNGNRTVNQTINFTSLIQGETSGGTSLIWDFGDGQISENAPPSISHTYTAPGTYNVKLTKINPEYEPLTVSHQIVINLPLSATAYTGSTEVDVCASPMERTITLIANVTGGCEAKNYRWFYRRAPSETWIQFSLEPFPTYDNCVLGSCEFKCTVSDNCGNSVETLPVPVTYSRSSNCPLCPN
jgi:YD repeat-containing protein